MKDLFITNKLRPTRIGFLVRPSDRASIRKIMRINACLWGGLYNPIIPVFRRPPSAWKNSFLPHEKITEIITGYIRFFEPDVYVESERGLIEKAGLSKFQGEKVGLKLQKVGLNIHSNGFNYSAGKCYPGFLEMHFQKKIACGA